MWLPIFTHAKFIRPIRDNLQALLLANEAESLAWANGGDAMPAYKVYRKALWFNTLWPVISILSQSTERAGPGNEVLPQTHSIVIEIEDEGSDPDVLATTVERRVQAVDMIITTANRGDRAALKAGIDAGHIAIREIAVTSHDYVQFRNRQNPERYLQTGSLTVVIETIEG